MKKTLVIFDIDGTLLHSNKIDSECFAETYQVQFGKTFPTIDWSKYPHVTDHVIFNTVIKQHFGRAANERDINRQQTHFVNLLKKKRLESPEDFAEVPGAVDAVNRLLTDNRYLLGIATGGWKAPASVKLNHLGFPIERFYDSYADDKESREAILAESLQKAKVDHPDIEHVVYVGDAIWDVQTTRNMQMNFLGIRHRGDIEFLRKAGAETVLQNFRNYGYFEELLHQAKPPLG